MDGHFVAADPEPCQNVLEDLNCASLVLLAD